MRERAGSRSANTCEGLPTGRGSSERAGEGTETVSQRTVVINLADTGDSQEDAYRLRSALQLLLEYPGTDRVHLDITAEGKRVRLDMPLITTAFCPELDERLASLIGPGRVLVI